jgi:2-dehydropantoate 2-reductase
VSTRTTSDRHTHHDTNTDILGAGSIGSLLAYNLAKAQVVAPVLMLRDAARQMDFKKRGSSVYFCGNDTPLSQFGIRHNYNTEPLLTGEGIKIETMTPDQIKEPLSHIIVTTKAQSTLSALFNYRDAIDCNTAMLFLQNGMGLKEQMDAKVWLNEDDKPHIFFGVTTHGAHRLPSPFYEYRHAGQGQIDMAVAPGTLLEENPFEEILQSSPTLGCQDTMPYPELLLKQSQKLVVNACVNPLTALMDCNNGQLLDSYATSTIINTVVFESSIILREYLLDTIGHQINPALISSALKPQRLNELINKVLQLTHDNSSSMREDVRNNRVTEIRYINKFLMDMGNKYKKPITANLMLYNLVNAQQDFNKF